MKQKRLKNITFSADADLIEKARKKALQESMTLNDAFRLWLEQFVRPVSSGEEFEKLMDSFKGVLSGNRFSREEANER